MDNIQNIYLKLILINDTQERPLFEVVFFAQIIKTTGTRLWVLPISDAMLQHSTAPPLRIKG